MASLRVVSPIFLWPSSTLSKYRNLISPTLNRKEESRSATPYPRYCTHRFKISQYREQIFGDNRSHSTRKHSFPERNNENPRKAKTPVVVFFQIFLLRALLLTCDLFSLKVITRLTDNKALIYLPKHVASKTLLLVIHHC